jgi:hypothetical protein
MVMEFSDGEASILLGATLMHWGVPFRSASKRELTDRQQAIVDEVSEKLIALRAVHQQSGPHETHAIELSDPEIGLLIWIVEDCLRECGNDRTELSLQLKTSDRGAVESLLERMRITTHSANGPSQTLRTGAASA